MADDFFDDAILPASPEPPVDLTPRELAICAIWADYQEIREVTLRILQEDSSTSTSAVRALCYRIEDAAYDLREARIAALGSED